LDQARNLADYLAPAFNTASGIPDNMINITTGALQTPGQSTGLAVAGTLVMEWTRLSDLLNDTRYADLAQRAESYLLKPQYTPPFEEPWPGLEGMGIDYTTGRFTDASGGWTGGSDSFYEYLIKMWVYDSEKYGEYKDRWIAAADSTIEHLLSHPSSQPQLSFVAGYNNRTLTYLSQHRKSPRLRRMSC
jgi:mannosyl-oligosaccharide alpha-1,2-mannosidase